MPYVGPCFEKLTSIMSTTEDSNLLVEAIKARTTLLSKAKGSNPDPAFSEEIQKCLVCYVGRAIELFKDKPELTRALLSKVDYLLKNNEGHFEEEKVAELFQVAIDFFPCLKQRQQELEERLNDLKANETICEEEKWLEASVEHLREIQLTIPDIAVGATKNVRDRQLDFA